MEPAQPDEVVRRLLWLIDYFRQCGRPEEIVDLEAMLARARGKAPPTAVPGPVGEAEQSTHPELDSSFERVIPQSRDCIR